MFGANYCGKVYPAQSYYPLNRQLTQLLTTTASVAVSFLKGAGKGMAATVQATLRIGRGAGKSLNSQSGVTVIDQNGVATTRYVATTVTPSTLKQIGKNLQATLTVLILFLKGAFNSLTVSNTVTTTDANGVQTTHQTSVSVTSSLAGQAGKLLTVAVSVTLSIGKAIAKFLSLGVTVSPTSGSGVITLLGVTVNINTEFGKQVAKSLATTVSAVLLVQLAVAFLLNTSVTVYLDLTSATSLKVVLMVVTATVTIVFQKHIDKLLQSSLNVSASLLKGVATTLTVAVSGVLAQFIQAGKQVFTGVTVFLGVRKDIAKSFSTSFGVAVQLVKGLLADLRVVVQATVDRLLTPHKTLEAQGTVQASQQNGVGILRAIQVVASSGFGKGVAKSLASVVQVFITIAYRLSGIPLISGIAYLGDRLFHRVHTGDKGE